MDEGSESFGDKLQFLFDRYFANRTLLVTIHQAIFPITQEVLYRVFSPYGSVKKIVPFQKFQFLILYQGYGAVAASRSLQSRNIYDGCCQLDIQFWDDPGVTDFELETHLEDSGNRKVFDKMGVKENEVKDVTDGGVIMDDESMENIGGLHGANAVARALPPPSAASLSVANPTSSVSSPIMVKGCIQLIQVTFQPSLFLDQSLLLGSSNLNLIRVIEKVGRVYALQDRLKEFSCKLEDDQFEKLDREFSTRLINANDLGENEDPYGFMLLLLGDELVIVDKNLLLHVNEVMDVKDPYRFRLLVMGNHLSNLSFKDTSLPFFAGYTFNEAPEFVVVMTLLKELDASKKLSTLVEGESLMNDETSIVIYELFYRMVLGQNCSWNLMIEILVKVSLAAMDIIIVFGISSILWLEFIFNETVVEITLTLVSYVVYFNGQEGIEVYGVLVVMILGMFCADVAKITFKGDDQQSLHLFWEMVAYTVNTLIVIQSEVVIAEGILDGIVFLTLIVNGSTTQFSLHFLDIDNLSAAKKRILDYTKYEMLNKAIEAFENLGDDEQFELVDWLTVRKTKVEKLGKKTALKGKIILTDLERWQKGVVNTNVFGATKEVTMQGQQASKPIPLILVKHADYHVLLGLNSQFLFKAEGDKKVIEQLVTTSELHKFGIIGRVVGNKDLYLGTFNTQEEAIEAYDIVAIELHGVNVVSNFDITKYDVDRNMASNTMFFRELARRNNEANAYSAPTPTYGEITQFEGNNGNDLDWNITLCLSSQQPSIVCITVEPLELKSASIGNYGNLTFSIALQDFIGVDLVNYMQPMVVRKVWAVEPKLSWMNANELIESGKLLPTIMKDLLLWWEPNVAKKKRALGDVWSNHLKKSRVLVLSSRVVMEFPY